MNGIEEGIWDNTHTYVQRIEMEWPPTTIEAFIDLISTARMSDSDDPLAVIQIGPSYLNERTFPEVEKILTYRHPDTVFISIDINRNIVYALRNQYGSTQQLFIPLHGNGWNFMDALPQGNISMDWVSHNVQVILAANNLAMVVERQPEHVAQQLIGDFLDQAKEALTIGGEIILIYNSASLRLKLIQPESSHEPVFTIPDHGYIEIQMVNQIDGFRKSYTTMIWNKWIQVLRNRTDAYIAYDLQPEKYLQILEAYREQ